MDPHKTRASSTTKRCPATKKRVSNRRQTAKIQEEELKTEVPDSDSDRTQHQISQNSDILSGISFSAAGRISSSILSKRLQETWETLQQTSSRQQQQEDATVDVQAAEKLKLLATELLQPKLLQHKDKNIQSLVACCLVEIMRVSSPDTPFSCEEELYRVFKLFIDQLRALTRTRDDDIYCFAQLFMCLRA
ncbi:unnamed protein product [Peronospora destructor]|uniref:Uncharacterized protein n=1 Tax=Peronospora destructor TaxID=86335 RepID=A0AAV0U7F1_9STRA|nr:unnamed protein product [Peronospora destructor]